MIPGEADPPRTIAGAPHRPATSPTGIECFLDETFLAGLRTPPGEAPAAALAGERGIPVRTAGQVLAALVELGFLPPSPGIPPLESPPAAAPTLRTGPLVSIVIANWNGAGHLEECLGAIAGQTYRPIETILVDNGSRDGSRAVVEREAATLPVRWIGLDRNTGFCHANNVGCREARGELVFLLNNDTRLDPDCVAHLVSALGRAPPDSVGVFPKLLFHWAPRVLNGMGTLWHRDHEWRDNRVGLLDLGGIDREEDVFGSLFAAVLLRRERFAEIGLFDRRFFSYGEDFDVCYRLNAVGGRLRLAPMARVFHKYRASSGERTDPGFSERLFLRNYHLVLLKNYQAGTLLARLPSAFRRYFVSYVAGAFRFRMWYRLRVAARVALDLLLLAPHVLRERWRLSRRRRVPDEALFVTRPMEDYNLFLYEGRIVLSLRALRISLGEDPESAPFFERRPADGTPSR